MTDTTTSSRTRRPPWKAVAATALAAFAVIFGGEALRMHDGHDPGLSSSSSGQANGSDGGSAASGSFDDGSLDGGQQSSGFDLPTTRSS